MTDQRSIHEVPADGRFLVMKMGKQLPQEKLLVWLGIQNNEVLADPFGYRSVLYKDLPVDGLCVALRITPEAAERVQVGFRFAAKGTLAHSPKVMGRAPGQFYPHPHP